MKRFLLAIVTISGLPAALIPAAASAQTVELGPVKAPVGVASCPPNTAPQKCAILLTRTTGLETIRDATAYPETAKASGVITAFTVGLSRLSPNLTTARNDVAYADKTYGGTARAAISILKPVQTKGARFTWQLVAQSPVYHLQPYLGQVVQFPLASNLSIIGAPAMAAPLPIARGDVVALTVPTWAPVLSTGLTTTDFAYRQSRNSACTAIPAGEQAQLTLNSTVRYGCNYRGNRVEYSATEITTPHVPKTQIHG